MAILLGHTTDRRITYGGPTTWRLGRQRFYGTVYNVPVYNGFRIIDLQTNQLAKFDSCIAEFKH